MELPYPEEILGPIFQLEVIMQTTICCMGPLLGDMHIVGPHE